MTFLIGFLTPSPQDMIILLVIGVLLFGKRLPEVGRYLGKGIVEFKKGLAGLEDEVDSATKVRPEATLDQPRPPQRVTTTVPKFEEDAGATRTTPPAN
jgi:sec-independent protein translocase protein TatA